MVEKAFHPQDNPISHSPISCRRLFCSESRLKSCVFCAVTNRPPVNPGSTAVVKVSPLSELLPDLQRSKKRGLVVKLGSELEEHNRKRDVKGT